MKLTCQLSCLKFFLHILAQYGTGDIEFHRHQIKLPDFLHYHHTNQVIDKLIHLGFFIIGTIGTRDHQESTN